jgi:signal transduction histidine kinase
MGQRMQEVQTLVAGDPAPRGHVRHLQGLVTARLQDIRATISLRRHGHARQARRLIASGRGKALMGAIRQEIAAMQAQETRILSQQRDKAQGSNQKALATVVIATLAYIALLGFVFFLVQRAIRRRDQINQERAMLLAREREARLNMEQLAAERAALLQQKDEFLSAAAHDLKTPLTIIKGTTQLLQQRAERIHTPDIAPVVDGLTRIDATAARMVNLINEMLDSTRIQMGRPLELVKRPVDLVALARRVVSEVRESDTRHYIEVETELEELTGSWDEGRLERVLGNILFNAIKYSPNGGDITVRISRQPADDGPRAVLSITDQGIGIPQKDLPHIFERFRRASNVDGAIPGTGIGLATVSQIVKQHGGAIEVESQEGQGSTFTIILPLEGQETADAKQADSASALPDRLE